jgi:dTDP-4-amino-4,6-dideoxygalactose transaminase
LHLQKAYAASGYATGDFPVAERCAAEIVSLPMFPGLRYEDRVRVSECVQAFLAREAEAAFAAAAGSSRG